MSQVTMGIRELKAGLSHYVRQVKMGATVIITQHGRPVGRIVPVESSLADRMHELVEAGIVSWSGEKLPHLDLQVRTRGNKSIADMLLEDRE